MTRAGHRVRLRRSGERLVLDERIAPGADPHRARDPGAQQGGGRPCFDGYPHSRRAACHRLAERIAEVEGSEVPVGSLDVTMYRDDLRLRPARALGRTPTSRPGGIDGETVVLVDDVLFSGRTIRAALDALERTRSTAVGAAGGAGRSRSPRAADPGRLRRQEPPNVAAETRQGDARPRSMAATRSTS